MFYSVPHSLALSPSRLDNIINMVAAVGVQTLTHSYSLVLTFIIICYMFYSVPHSLALSPSRLDDIINMVAAVGVQTLTHSYSLV
jgi:hypothetical protein